MAGSRSTNLLNRGKSVNLENTFRIHHENNHKCTAKGPHKHTHICVHCAAYRSVITRVHISSVIYTWPAGCTYIICSITYDLCYYIGTLKFIMQVPGVCRVICCLAVVATTYNSLITYYAPRYFTT